jgi:hypothetical protein
MDVSEHNLFISPTIPARDKPGDNLIGNSTRGNTCVALILCTTTLAPSICSDPHRCELADKWQPVRWKSYDSLNQVFTNVPPVARFDIT